MFCKKCGQELADNVKFCPKCGEKTETIIVPNRAVAVKSEEENKKTYRMVGIAVLVIAVFLLFTLFGGKGYEKVVKNYYKSIQNGNANLYYSLLAPDYINYMVGPGSWYSSKEDFKKDLGDDLEEKYDDYTYVCGDNLKFSVKVLKTTKYTAKETNELSKTLRQDYEFKHNVNEVIKATCLLTVRGSEETVSNNTELYLIKVGGKWYLQRGYVGEGWQD